MASPVDHVAFHARLQPERLAVVDLASEQRWSYAQFDRAIACCARVLRDIHRVQPGERVASLARNRAELAMLHLACARMGAIYVPLNWRLSGPEIEALLEDAEPRLLVGDAELAGHGVAGLLLDELMAAIRSAEPLVTPAIDPSRPSLILYTSGTSGRPKGALLNERNIGQTAINFSQLGRVTRDSVFLLDSPMFHVIGLVCNIRPALMQGGTIVISDGFVPARTLARLGDPSLQVTHYFCVPQMAEMLRAEPGYDPMPLSGLTGLFTGGAPHPAADIHAWLVDGVPVVHGFGMSEAGTVFGMAIEPELLAAKAGSVGMSTPAVQARIVDADERDCPAGAAGELLLRGETVFGGYWRRPEETAGTFTDDGWFRTGDIAMCDADGFYWMVDRKKDMFISGGENVYPAEIEAELAGYRGLADYAVVGIPDARWGEVGVAALVVGEGAQVDIEALAAHLAGRLARYKLPKRYVIVESLPRTGSGKVRKTDLRLMLSQVD